MVNKAKKDIRGRTQEHDSPMHFELNFIPIQRLRRPKECESPMHFELNFIPIQRLRRPKEREMPSRNELRHPKEVWDLSV